ncbi:MAG: hypothetical protein OXI34_06730 [Chloroflexota bacterium]|nr:hypothetical protein [Chloroflexota bacterium]MDE2946307.1 hypothetical protein [Chloroflexota bacterium]
MRIFALIFPLIFAGFIHAQETTPVSRQSNGDDPASPVSNNDSADAGDAQSSKLESPFLQADLELMVGNVQRPNGIVWFKDAIYTVCNGDWTIYKIDDRSGDTVTFVFGVRNGSNLIAEETETGFDLWVPDADMGNLWKVDERRGAPVSVTAGLAAPWGIARLNDESFLISDTRSNSILQAPTRGEPRTAVNGLRAPTGIARQGSTFYVANGGSARRGIEYFELDADGGFTDLQPLVSGLQNTSNIVMGADGYLYFSYALGTRGVIGRVEPAQCHDGGCGNQDVEMVVFSDLPAPLAITLSDDMRLFLHSRYRPEFYWVQLPT